MGDDGENSADHEDPAPTVIPGTATTTLISTSVGSIQQKASRSSVQSRFSRAYFPAIRTITSDSSVMPGLAKAGYRLPVLKR